MVDLLLRSLASLRWQLFPPLFAIDIRNGAAHVRRGDPPGALVREFTDVADDLGILRGTIYGVRSSHGVTLAFSPEIPAAAHQRLRNVLAIHRHRIARGP